MLHETEYNRNAVYLTLTYKNAYLPGNATLRKKDYQNFINRLRMHLSRKDYPWYDKIRYYIAGEYGDRHSRPHYHLILWGIPLRWFRKTLLRYKNGHPVYTSLTLQSEKKPKLWYFGENTIGEVSRETCAYVAGYVQKKLFGARRSAWCKRSGRIAEFNHGSNGIGKEWMEAHESELTTNLCISYAGYKIALPRYYRRKLGIGHQKYRAMVISAIVDDLEAYYNEVLHRTIYQDQPDAFGATLKEDIALPLGRCCPVLSPFAHLYFDEIQGKIEQDYPGYALWKKKRRIGYNENIRGKLRLKSSHYVADVPFIKEIDDSLGYGSQLADSFVY